MFILALVLLRFSLKFLNGLADSCLNECYQTGELYWLRKQWLSLYPCLPTSLFRYILYVQKNSGKIKSHKVDSVGLGLYPSQGLFGCYKVSHRLSYKISKQLLMNKFFFRLELYLFLNEFAYIWLNLRRLRINPHDQPLPQIGMLLDHGHFLWSMFSWYLSIQSEQFCKEFI